MKKGIAMGFFGLSMVFLIIPLFPFVGMFVEWYIDDDIDQLLRMIGFGIFLGVYPAFYQYKNGDLFK